MKKFLLLTVSHLAMAFAGFAAGIYALPILAAPPGPSAQQLQQAQAVASYSGQFRRDLKGSDSLHWGEGKLTLGRGVVSLQGRLAPGPDYKLYLSPQYVETKADFLRLKSQMLRVSDVKTFDGFVVNLPAGVELERYNTVVIWCEAFSQFITAAQYR